MKVIIIGNGLAGVTVASNLVNLDDSIEIDIISEEKYTYYSRVRLVDYMVNKISLDDLIIYDESWYEQRDINLHLNSRVTKLNTSKNKISIETTLEDGKTETKELEYDTLVIACGSKPIIPDIKVKRLDEKGKEELIPLTQTDIFGWHILRNINDADQIKEHLKQAERIIILGTGLLGLEIAHNFREGDRSRDTSIIEIESSIAPVYLDKQGSLVLLNLLERAGIKVLTNIEVTELVGDKSIEGCRLSDKTIHKGDMVIFACGIEPNIDFLKDTPIEIIDGIVVNEFMQTSVKNIYAVGDCCEFNEFIYGINPAAIEQAKHCAWNIVKPEGKTKIYDGTIPSVSFNGFDTELVSLGSVNEYTLGEEEWKDIYSYYKVDLTMGIYKKILLKKHRIIGAILIGDLESQFDIRRLIFEKIDVSAFEEKILQDGFELRDYI
ncbi:MAG: NAD(P)/FAD-dependent oxidoreductase [Candidatus Hodarchaeota archaeon]